jgi:hypothetical protein
VRSHLRVVRDWVLVVVRSVAGISACASVGRLPLIVLALVLLRQSLMRGLRVEG